MAEMDLPARVTVIEGAISELRDQNKAIVAELRNISTVLTGQVAQSGPSLMAMLSVGAKVVTATVVTVSAVATVIIFLARGVSSEDYHTLDKRIIMLESRMAATGK